MLYFLLHDAGDFHGRLSPAFAASWRQRSFGPIVQLAADLEATLADFANRFHLTADERPLLADVTATRPFDRRFWRHIVGEVLLYAAADAPAIQTAPETLSLLVNPDGREWIQQAHAGSRDLNFNGVPYRSGHAGWNDVTDVARLTSVLAQIDSASWTATNLDDDDAAEEIEFARECFAALSDLYRLARERGQVVVCEDF
jgi:hypothetical protein